MLGSRCGWEVLFKGAVELACWRSCKGRCFRVLQRGYILFSIRIARILVKGVAACCTLQGATIRVALAYWCHYRILQDTAAGYCRIFIKNNRKYNIVKK